MVYPSLAGTNVAQDFVELPSQLNENWLATHEVLSRFAVNTEGQPIPDALVAKILNSRTFNTGFAVTEYLSAAIVDMKLHTTPQGPDDPPIDVGAFERETLNALGMPAEIVMRHRTPQFGHIFQSDGYAAGYYSTCGPRFSITTPSRPSPKPATLTTPAWPKRLLDDILSVGDTIDPAQAYRNFRGRDPDVGAYLRSKGFQTA
ncbi:MAG: M3 family metallopeptidase [Caulobacteraceae bacterium]